MADETQTLAQIVRAKFPGAYDSVSDAELEGAVMRKYPGAYDKVPKSPYKTAVAEEPANVFNQDIGTSMGDAVVGGVKQLGTMLGGVKHVLTQSPVKTLTEATEARYAAGRKGDDPSKGIIERGAYKVAGMVPFVGPAMAAAGEALGSGDPETMGRGVTDTAMLVGGVSPGSRAAAGSAAKGVASRIPGVVGATNLVKRVAAEAPAAVRTGVSNMREHPMATAIGAYEGYQAAGLPGAAAGAVGLPVGMHSALRTITRAMKPTAAANGAKTPSAMQPRLVKPDLEAELQAELTKRVDEIPSRPEYVVDDAASEAATAARLEDAAASPMRPRANYDSDSTIDADYLGRPAPPEAAAATPEATPATSDAITRQLLARERLAEPIDYRANDVVPVDAMKRDTTNGGAIHMAGESRIGLMEQLTRLLKENPADAAGIEALRKAISQRMKIGAERTMRSAPRGKSEQ